MRAETKTAPQKNSAPPALTIFAAAVLGAAAIGVCATVFFFNPGTHGFYPVCLFHELTGLNCPGCGSTRALFALLHGHFQLALKDNALFLLTLAVLAFWGVRIFLQKLKHQPATFSASPKFFLAFLVVAIVFGVLRNLPGFEWLSP
jgi:hypothetical protein